MGQWNPVEIWKKSIGLLIAGDFERLPVTKDCAITEPAMGTHFGYDEERKAFARDYSAAFSNIVVTFENTVVQGRKLAVQARYEMDHTGPLKWTDRTIPATGNHLEIRVGYFITFDREGEGALISRIHQYYDSMELFQKMGAA